MTAPADVRTCYRHPDRVAGISCQRCDRPICPQCMHQASVGFHCPECARAGAQREYRGVSSLRTRPLATQVLIAVNLLLFAASAATAGAQPWTLGGRLLAQVGHNGGLFADGALAGVLVPEEPWRLVTGGFLHAGIFHVAVNMYSLWILGQVLEPALGRGRYLALYAASLLGGSLGVVLIDAGAVTVGASGAIFGLFGAIILVARESRIDLMRSGLLPILGLNLLFTFLIPGISIGGHLGGLAVGFACTFGLIQGTRRLGARGATVTTAVTSGLAVALAGVAFVLMTVQYG